MDIQILTAMLTEGLPEDQAKIVRDAIARDAVKTKAAGLKQESEYNELQTRLNTLNASYEGSADKPGARAYQDWYEKNYTKVDQVQKDLQAYQAKYGTLENPNPANPNPAPAPALDPAAIERAIDQRIQNVYGKKWSDLLVSTGGILQKHVRAGRKTDINFAELGVMAAEKYNGNLEQAYDEWDKPEREKVAKDNVEAEITKRVQEEMQKRGGTTSFPAGADAGPGTLAARSTKDFDKGALMNELARTFVTGEYTPGKVN